MEIGDFDWDTFEAEGRELERRMRAVVADLNRQKIEYGPSPKLGGPSEAREQPPHESAWEGRLDRFERMLAETLNTVTVLQRDVNALQRDVTGLQRDVAELQRDVRLIREQMATRVEVEGLRDSINIVADGFAQTQMRQEHVADLLKRYLVS